MTISKVTVSFNLLFLHKNRYIAKRLCPEITSITLLRSVLSQYIKDDYEAVWEAVTICLVTNLSF